MIEDENTRERKLIFIEKFRNLTDDSTVKEIAKRLDVSEDTVKKWRSPESATFPSADNMFKLCKEYNCTPNWLYGYEDSYNLQYKKMTEIFGLSGQALNNIRQEASEDGDNRKTDMLDRLLSNRKAFTDLMACLIALHDPSSIVMDRKAFLKVFLDSENDSVILPASAIKQLSVDTPENVHHRIRVILDDFIKQME